MGAVALGLAYGSCAFAREYINIVGSSTVYPFAATVAEHFGKTGGSEQNGVTDILEVKIGYDGIAIANSKVSPQYKLSLKDVLRDSPVRGLVIVTWA